MKTLVKFCGLTRIEDVLAAAVAGVGYLGFVLVPGSRRYLPREALPVLLAAVPENVKKVFVTADLELAEIAQLIADFQPDVIQLHGRETPDYARTIHGAEVWKAVQPKNALEVEESAAYPAEFLVVDAEQGGSGQCCDWQLAARLAARRRIFLAGGLKPSNVSAALRCSRAAGIDVASGIEIAPGQKDQQKMRQLLLAIRQYEQQYNPESF